MGAEYAAVVKAVRRPMKRWWRTLGLWWVVAITAIMVVSSLCTGSILGTITRPDWYSDVQESVLALVIFVPLMIASLWLLAAIHITKLVQDLGGEIPIPGRAGLIVLFKFRLMVFQLITPFLLIYLYYCMWFGEISIWALRPALEFCVPIIWMSALLAPLRRVSIHGWPLLLVCYGYTIWSPRPVSILREFSNQNLPMRLDYFWSSEISNQVYATLSLLSILLLVFCIFLLVRYFQLGVKVLYVTIVIGLIGVIPVYLIPDIALNTNTIVTSSTAHVVCYRLVNLRSQFEFQPVNSSMASDDYSSITMTILGNMNNRPIMPQFAWVVLPLTTLIVGLHYLICLLLIKVSSRDLNRPAADC